MIEIVNALAGALALQAGYLIAVRRLQVGRGAALLATAIAGSSFGLWYYSTTIETYVIPLALLAWSFYLLSAGPPTVGRLAATAVGHSAATLFHQSAILFGAVVACALLTAFDASGRRVRLSSAAARLVLYVVLCGAIVGGSYVVASRYDARAQQAPSFITWVKGYGNDTHFWKKPPRAFVEAAIGFGRAVFGGHYAFAISGVPERLQSAFPGKYLGDEAFLVRSLPSARALSLLLLTLVVTAVTAIAAVRAAGNAWRRRFAADPRTLGLLLVWLLAYGTFFTFWDPSNSDFWVVQTFLLWYVLVALLKTRSGLPLLDRCLLATAGAGLFVVTCFGVIRFTSNPANDFYRVHLQAVSQVVRPDDVLVIGDDWPIARHIGYRLKMRAIYLTAEVQEHTPAEVAASLSSHLSQHQRVFISRDVLEAKQESVAAYGPRYKEYVAQVAAHICGTTPLPAREHELELLQVTCISP